MATYRDQGIVLRTYKLGETDRIVILLTQGRGKVRAVAKGVRRPGSRFGGRLEPYGHVDLQLYEGRSLDIINQAELLDAHAGIREDWGRSACASVMVEADRRGRAGGRARQRAVPPAAIGAAGARRRVPTTQPSSSTPSCSGWPPSWASTRSSMPARSAGQAGRTPS
jgi:hypothetical protein